MTREERRSARRRRLHRRRLAAVAVVLAAAGAAGAAIALRSPGGPAAVTRSVQARAEPRGARHPEVTPTVLRLPAQLPARVVRVPILMYHRIGPFSPRLPAITRRLTVDPATFAAQMHWLHAHSFHAVTQLQLFDALFRGTALASRPVLITFDDGYRDVLWNAAPVLAQLHMPATAYVITGRVSGSDSSFLTWGNLRALERHGVAIGSHTVHHLELPLLSDADATRELVDSRHTLEARLGHPVQWFAYPAGAENARAVQLVRAAGYVLAVTTHPGAQQAAAHPLELQRYEVLDSTGVGGLAALVR